MAATVTLRTRRLVVVVLIAGLVGAGVRSLIASPAPTTSTGAAGRAERAEDGERGQRGADRDLEDKRGSGRDTAGALGAATRYVRAGQRIYDLPSPQRPAALRAMAADAAADAYVIQQSARMEELDGVAARGEGLLTWHVAVLATRVAAITRQRARVEIWRLGTLSIGGLTAPLAEFSTVTYELVWEHDRWRIWSETQVPGPSPMPHPEAKPATPTQWQRALEGFTRFPGNQAL